MTVSGTAAMEKGTVKLYRDGKLIYEVIYENAGCEYGEYDPAKN